MEDQEKSNFLSLLGKEEAAKPTSSEKTAFDSLVSSPSSWTKPEAPSISEQLDTSGAIYSQEALAGLYSLPSTTAETWRALGGFFQERGEKLAAKEGREVTPEEKKTTDLVVNAIPDFVKYLGEKFPKIFPSHQRAKEIVGEKIKAGGGNIPEKPRGAIERAASGAGKATQLLAFPGSGVTKLAAIGTSAATEASELPEGWKLTANMGVPALTALIQAIITKRYIPKPGEAAALYKEAKDIGFTDKQLAPILATESQVEKFGPLAQGVKATKTAFEETRDALGVALQDLTSRPSSKTALSAQAESTLLNKLNDVKRNLQTKTHSLGDKEQSLVEFVDKAIQDIMNGGSSPEQIIGTWRSMNKIGQGKTALRQLEGPFLEAIESVDPQLAKDFQTVNGLYSKYITNLKEISPSQFNAFIDAGELQQVLSAVFSPQTHSLPAKIANLFGVNVLRKISSAMLTDPRAQSLVRNFGQAVRDGRSPSAQAVWIQLKDYVQKNLPEEYKEVDWERLVPSHAKEQSKDRNDGQ